MRPPEIRLIAPKPMIPAVISGGISAPDKID